MLELRAPKGKAVKLWSITAQSSTGSNLKDSLSGTGSFENPTGSFFNKQTKTGFLLPSGEWGRAGVSPGTKQRQTCLLPQLQRSCGERHLVGAKNYPRCLPAIWLCETRDRKGTGERMARPQHGTKAEIRACWRTALEISPTGVSSSNVSALSQLRVGTGTDKCESHSGKHPSGVTHLTTGPVITLP